MRQSTASVSTSPGQAGVQSMVKGYQQQQQQPQDHARNLYGYLKVDTHPTRNIRKRLGKKERTTQAAPGGLRLLEGSEDLKPDWDD